jgi:HlyD family secretion protein
MKLIGIIVFVVALALASYLVLRPTGVLVEVRALENGEFVESIESEGRLRSRDKRLIAASADGYLERVSYRSGDAVKKGERLAVLRWDRDLNITSPIDGIVSKVYREAAGPVTRSEPLLEVLDPGNIEVVVELLTADAVRVQIGSRMTISGWGEQQRIDLKVSRVSRAGFTKVSALGVEEERTEVVALVNDSKLESLSRIGDNFHVEAEIEIGRQSQALQVPLAALFRDGSTWSVYRIEKSQKGDRAFKKSVEIGARNATMGVVQQGLTENDTVVIYPGDLLRDGVRVKMK